MMFTIIKKITLLLLLSALLTLVGVSIWVIRDYQFFLESSIQLPTSPMIYTVESGRSFRSLANDLVDQGIIRNSYYLVAYARRAALTQKIKAGEFNLTSEMTPVGLLDHLVSGQAVQYSLTIVEGWNFREMMQAITAHKSLMPTLDGVKPMQIMEAIGVSENHPEGLFFPDTYYFPNHTTDRDFLLRAYRMMQQKLAAAWGQRAENLPLQTPYEALILASIVEKETSAAQERAQIAGVFVRRLLKGMRLQTDPTVIYGLGEEFDGNIRRKDLRTDHPYNTYLRAGLPPTPIALPSQASIEAVLHPAAGKTLYFVARGDGSHYFSTTLDEHNAAVRKYQLKPKK